MPARPSRRAAAFAVVAAAALLARCPAGASAYNVTQFYPREVVVTYSREAGEELPRRVSFASCYYPFYDELTGQVWRSVRASSPDIWIWTGDMVYADYGESADDKLQGFKSLQRIRRQFESVSEGTPGYVAMRREVPFVIGVYDDHDCGVDACDRNFPFRQMTKQMFLDAIGEPPYSGRRMREGMYQSYFFGYDYEFVSGTRRGARQPGGYRAPPPGRAPLPPADSLRVVVLDLRTFRDVIGNTQLVGEDQWRWLHRLLIDPEERVQPAAVTVFVSSTTLVPTDLSLNLESWDKFPSERIRFIRMLKRYTEDTGTQTLVMSGDVHIGSIFTTRCVSEVPGSGENCTVDEETRGFRVWEVTASGMTHTTKNDTGSFGLGLMKVASESSVCPVCHTELPHFGVMDINWRYGRFDLQIRSVQTGRPLFSKLIRFRPLDHLAGLSGPWDVAETLVESVIDNGRSVDTLDRNADPACPLRRIRKQHPAFDYNDQWSCRETGDFCLVDVKTKRTLALFNSPRNVGQSVSMVTILTLVAVALMTSAVCVFMSKVTVDELVWQFESVGGMFPV